MRAACIVVCGIIAALPLVFGPPEVYADMPDNGASSAILVIHKGSRMLQIRGQASSIAHELILQQAADRYFGQLALDIDLDRTKRTPPGWSLVTELVLRALAHTDAARATVTTETVSIEGITSRPDEYAAALQRVKRFLLDGMAIDSAVSAMASDQSFEQLCRTRFQTVTASGRIEFAVSSADFEGNAAPLLDALIEIAVDCPAMTIIVTGYTDHRGEAIANEALGRARAERVIEYMAERGVPSHQFGPAAARIVPANADNSGAFSRQLSRRADLEMVPP